MPIKRLFGLLFLLSACSNLQPQQGNCQQFELRGKISSKELNLALSGDLEIWQNRSLLKESRVDPSGVYRLLLEDVDQKQPLELRFKPVNAVAANPADYSSDADYYSSDGFGVYCDYEEHFWLQVESCSMQFNLELDSCTIYSMESEH